MYYNLVANLEQPCTKLPATGPPTILFEVFWTQQKRKRLVEVALEGIDLPPDDYPFYVTIGADGPLTPTALAELLDDAALDGHLPRAAARAPRPCRADRQSRRRALVPDPADPGRAGGCSTRRGRASGATPRRSRRGSARRKTTALALEPRRAQEGDRRGAGRYACRTRPMSSAVGTPPCRMYARGSR